MNDDRCSDDAVRALLGLHALGRLCVAEQEYVQFHLDDCLACQDELAGLRAVTSALDLLSPADVAEILVADMPAAADPMLPRASCLFTFHYRTARGTAGSSTRRSTAPQLPPGER